MTPWMLLVALLLLLTGVLIGFLLTRWRWNMALQMADRAREWDRTAIAVRKDVAKQIRSIDKLDYTVGTLAVLIKAHLKVTTPETLRGAIARMVGEDRPSEPTNATSGWDTPIPPFESPGLSKSGTRSAASGPKPS